MAERLSGARVVITRPEGQLEPLCERLRTLGAEPIKFPVIAVADPIPGGDLDRAINHLTDYDWIIFTSVNGVEHFWARLASVLGKGVTRTGGIPNFGGKIAAIGPATAAALAQHRIGVHLVPGEYRAEAILEAIGDVDGSRILLPRADIARADLAHGLRERGAHVDEVPAYRTVPATPPPEAFEELGRGVDIIAFTSS